MGMVPDEKALVERMKGGRSSSSGSTATTTGRRRSAIVAKEGMNWRSFWDGGRIKGITVKWGVKQWPTVYVIDARASFALKVSVDPRSTRPLKSLSLRPELRGGPVTIFREMIKHTNICVAVNLMGDRRGALLMGCVR